MISATGAAETVFAMPATTLSLRTLPDGCALVTAQGVIVYRSYGPFARRRCLRRAALAGVLRLRG